MSWFALFFLAGAVSAFIAWACAWGIRRYARVFALVDTPDAGRRRHGRPVALAGGVAAWFAILCAVIAVWMIAPSLLSGLQWFEWMSFVVAPIPLLIVGVLDDRYRLSPGWLLFGAALSIALALMLGIRIERVTNLAGGALGFRLWASLLVSSLWLLACMGSTKFADGVDGLVAGQTVIGALLIAWLCLMPAYFQPHIGLLAALFGGAFFGVLLHNWPRARLFLGEFGSTFAGFGLGILASISGAKVAIALMAMGVFVADIVWVMARRVWRGRSPLEGDRTHLHFVLLAAGVPSWAVALIVWGLGLGFGIAALQFQTQGKMILALSLILLTWTLSYGAEKLAHQKGVSLV